MVQTAYQVMERIKGSHCSEMWRALSASVPGKLLGEGRIRDSHRNGQPGIDLSDIGPVGGRRAKVLVKHRRCFPRRKPLAACGWHAETQAITPGCERICRQADQTALLEQRPKPGRQSLDRFQFSSGKSACRTASVIARTCVGRYTDHPSNRRRASGRTLKYRPHAWFRGASRSFTPDSCHG